MKKELSAQDNREQLKLLARAGRKRRKGTATVEHYLPRSLLH